MDDVVQLKLVANAAGIASIETVEPSIYIICNLNQCNGQETVNRVKNIIGMNSFNMRAMIAEAQMVSYLSSINTIDLGSLFNNIPTGNQPSDNTQFANAVSNIHFCLRPPKKKYADHLQLRTI